jgi:hypothetical protein
MAMKNSSAEEQKNPQENDIVILHNKLDKMLEALAKPDKEGGPGKMVPFDDENRNSFLKIDRGANWLESFLKNLTSQFKEPSHFNLFAIGEAQLDDPKIRKALKELAEGKQTKAVGEFLDKYEIRLKNPEQAKESGIDWEALKKDGITREGLEKMGLLDDFLKKHAAQASGQSQQTRFNESLVPWAELQKVGLTREYLVRRDILPGLLNGYKSRDLVPMTIDTGSVRARIEGRIALMHSPDGLKLMVWGVKQTPPFDRPFHGHVFSPEDRRNLMETGNMGRTVELLRDGESTLSFVSRDRLTNDLYAVRVEDVFVPREVQNYKLSDHEMNELKEGRAIKLELTSEKGNDYSATVQISAERRGVEYSFVNSKLFNAETLGGAKLSQDQRDRLNAGESVLVENMTAKESGMLYDRYVKLDPASGRPLFFQFNPDSPEDARQVIVPKELGGQKISEDDRATLREGGVIHQPEMVSQKGETLPPFVRLDLQTGRVQYSRDPNKFDERPRFEVPQKVHNVQLTAVQRAQLQDGKAILVEGIVGTDGKVLSQYAKVNKGQTHIELSNDNPDARQKRAQREVEMRPTQENKQGRGRSI